MLNGDCQGKFLGICRLMACSTNQFQLLLSRMLQLNENEYLEPKMSDFEWFGEVFNISTINMLSLFAHFWSQFRTDFNVNHSNWSLGPPLQSLLRDTYSTSLLTIASVYLFYYKFTFPSSTLLTALKCGKLSMDFHWCPFTFWNWIILVTYISKHSISG